MAEAEPTKVCPLCAETIKAAAKVCPFCQSKQRGFTRRLQDLLLGLPALAVFITGMWVLSRFSPDDPGRDFRRHRDELVVMDTALGPSDGGNEYRMTGVVTNRGQFPWRVRTFEVRFLDEHGGLLDALHPNARDAFVVGAHQETGFGVSVGRLAFTNHNIVRQVTVQLATDADRRPETTDE